MSAARALPATVLTALLLAASGCGSSSDPQPEKLAAVGTEQPTAPKAGGVTEAELGDASSASSGSEGEDVSPGGDVPPGVELPKHPGQEGVGAETACPGATALPSSTSATATTTATLCLINQERKVQGLVALTQNVRLDSAAKTFAAAMVAKKFFGHVGPDGSTMTTRIKKTGYLTGRWTIGENLAWGSGELATPKAIVAAWLNSPGHRRNILDPAFKHIGLALLNGLPSGSGSGGATYVNEFGSNGSFVAKSRLRARIRVRR